MYISTQPVRLVWSILWELRLRQGLVIAWTSVVIADEVGDILACVSFGGAGGK
jgi:hypothetical protein